MPVVDTSPRRLFIVFNPLSGGNRRPHLDAVIERIRHLGGTATLASSQIFDEIVALSRDAAQSSSYDAVVAGGGDGTVRAVASGLSGSRMPLGVIPLGTANVLALELNFPRSANAIARMLLGGPVIEVSCGALAGRPFLLMASAGLDASIVAHVHSPTKRRFGKLAYVPPILSQLTTRPPSFQAIIDGRPLSCTWLIVSNARNYAGRFEIAPERSVVADGFTALAITARRRRDLLRVAMAFACGGPPPTGLVERVPCRSAEIPNLDGVPVQVDGDPLDASSFRIDAEKTRQPLIVPDDCPELTHPRVMTPSCA